LNLTTCHTHATFQRLIISGDCRMKSILLLLALACVAAVAVPNSVNAGLFCHAKPGCCEPVCYTPAPTCCAPAPVCCPQPVPCCAPAPVCCPESCGPFRRGLLRRMLHCSEPCCPAPIPAPCCTPVTATSCASVAPGCGSAGYGYSYGVANNSPHWF